MAVRRPRKEILMQQRSFTPLAFGLIVSTIVAAVAWTRVRNTRHDTIDVTGAAKRRIVSDLIEWDATLTAKDADRFAATRALRGHADKTVAWLKSQGLKDEEIHPSAVTSVEAFETETRGSGENRVEKEVSQGWTAVEVIHVRSSDVAKVDEISRDVTRLLEDGVPVSSQSPRYIYTKLGEVKIRLLADASADARVRAQRIIASAGGSARLGSLTSADMGVINVNPANSTATSWEGNNDTTSLEKDVITVVHAKYRIEDE